MPRKPKAIPKRITCGDCMKKVDEDALFAALNAGGEYRHDCGRVLIRVKKDKPVEDVT